MRAYLGASIVVFTLVVCAFGALHLQRDFIGAYRHVVAAPPKLARAVPVPPEVPLDPSQLWVGEDGVDATGYPTRQVERAALQALVRTGRFAQAQEFFALLNTEFERDFRKEYWLIGAARAFETADPRLTPQLDAWISRFPRSAPAYTARAAHRMATAWAQRGSGYARETSTGQMIGFEDTMALSSEDAQRALKLSPRFLPAYAYLARVAGTVGRAAPPMASIVDRASEECPLCVSVRATAMWFELPVWGGSPERAQALADAGMRDLAKNARLSVLAGYVSDVRCDMAERAKQYDSALAECTRAVEAGPFEAKFYVERAQIQRMLKHDDLALADLDRARELDPYHFNMLERRPELLLANKRYREATDDLLRARSIDPVNPKYAAARAQGVTALVYDGWEAGKQGDQAKALSLYDMALELDPENRDARMRRLAASTGAGAIQALEQRVAQNPDDFGLHRQLDDVYFRQGRLDDIVAMWTKFLARHPDHGLAYWERSGTYHHKRDNEHSMADARSACRLGVSQACAAGGGAQ